MEASPPTPSSPTTTRTGTCRAGRSGWTHTDCNGKVRPTVPRGGREASWATVSTGRPDVWRPAVPIIPDRTAGLFQLAPLSSERAGYFSLAWLLDILRTVLRLRRGDAMAIAPEKSMNELGAEFYTLMGNAISNWARVEAYLFKICRAALGATSQRTAIVYGRTPTIESRRLLVDDLLATRFPVRRQNGGSEHPDSREWKSISISMQGLLPVRNQIAHRPMEPHLDWTESADGGVGKADLWFEITTSEHERERYGGPKGSLNVADLKFGR